MRIVLYVLAGLLGLILAFVLLLVLMALFAGNKEREKDNKFYRSILNFAMGIVTFFMRIKVIVVNKAKLEGLTGRFLLVSNHRSNFDPLITIKALKKYELAFLSKAENFKIPIVGRYIKRCCFLAIDRENPRNAILALKKASNLIANNQVSVGVYPEGTRSKDCSILPFHDGVFKIAQYAKVPIVVMTVIGTENIKKNAPFKKTRVIIEINRILSIEEVMQKSTHDISEIVKQDYIETIAKYQD